MNAVNAVRVKFLAECKKIPEEQENKTKVICANSKFELRNVTVGEVA